MDSPAAIPQKPLQVSYIGKIPFTFIIHTIFRIEIPDCVSVRRPFSLFWCMPPASPWWNPSVQGGNPPLLSSLSLVHSLTCLLAPVLPLSLILLIKIPLRNRSFSLDRLSTMKLSTSSLKKTGTYTFTLDFKSSLTLLSISSVLIMKLKKKPTFVSTVTFVYIKKPMKSWISTSTVPLITSGTTMFRLAHLYLKWV